MDTEMNMDFFFFAYMTRVGCGAIEGNITHANGSDDAGCKVLR